MNTTPARPLDLEQLHIARGAHPAPEGGLCLLEAVAYIAGEEHTDHPDCVDPILGTYGRRLNDRLDDDTRQLLKPLILRLPGTRDDGHSDTRLWMLRNHTARVAVPRWLDATGRADLATLAEQLRALDEITDPATYRDAQTVLAAVRAITWPIRRDRRERIKALVRAELDRPLPDAADAVAVAVAVAAADAAADAVAAAVAAADAVAAAAADAAADADAAWPSARWNAAYNAAYPIFRKRFAEIPALAQARQASITDAIALFDRLIDPTQAVA